MGKIQALQKICLDSNIKTEIRAMAKDIVNEIEIHGKKKKVINTGMLKAGKSTLFNALSCTNEFETDVVRATTINKALELDKYILIDTPGLNANDEDTEVAFQGYKESDLLLFVHNSIDGELSKIEIDFINDIAKLFGGVQNLLPKCILVLTNLHINEKEEMEKLKDIIQEQCNKIFFTEFGDAIGVDSTTYIKGVNESKNLLIEASNINTLKKLISNTVGNKKDKSLFDSYIKERIMNLSKQIDLEINSIQEEIDIILKEKHTFEKIENAKKIINKATKDVKLAIEKEIRESRKEIGEAWFIYDNKDYIEYSSKYKAESEAKKMCEKNITNAASRTRREGLDMMESCRDYFYSNDGLNKLKTKLMYYYDNIKEASYEVINIPKTIKSIDINIKDDSNSKSLMNKINNSCSYIANISESSFMSAYDYFKRYQYNLDISYDYRTDYVEGLFGLREKRVKYYTWDIEGANNDIKSDTERILRSKAESGLEAYSELIKYNTDSFYENFEKATNSILERLDKEKLRIEAVNLEIENKVKLKKTEEDLFIKVKKMLERV